MLCGYPLTVAQVRSRFVDAEQWPSRDTRRQFFFTQDFGRENAAGHLCQEYSHLGKRVLERVTPKPIQRQK
jgi:hypothetical protein